MLLLTHQTRPFESELIDHIAGVYYPESEDFCDLPPHIDAAFISCGYFSSVWAIPGEPFKVLKVSHRAEDCCRDYMQWAYANPHPNAPTIHSIEHVDHMMLVVMERYSPLPDDLTMPYEESYAYRENVPGHEVLMGYRQPDHRLGHEQLCARIRREFIRVKFDLHKDNVMVARDGRIIITDPVSYKVNNKGEIIYDD